MASDKRYLQYVLDQLPEEVSARPMMGEFLLYYRGKCFGGIYDNRFLVKPVPGAVSRMPDVPTELPYPGASGMLPVERLEDPAFLKDLIEAMHPELPEQKKKRK